MMRRIACGLLLLALAGCQSKLEYSKFDSVDFGETKTSFIDGPTYEQEVTITTNGEGGTYSVYVCLESDYETVEKMIGRGESPGGLLASEMNTRSAAFTVKIPAKAKFAVLLKGGERKAKVHLSVTGK